MINPRRTTLHRAADLAAFRTALSDWISALAPQAARDTAVLVPTAAAAEQLRRTVEARALTSTSAAIAWPVFVTRPGLYDELSSRLPGQPRLLMPVEREVLLASACEAVQRGGLELPYALRPGLVAEMLELYDEIRRLGRRVDDFERNFCDALERDQEVDRGAARLLQQTVFLTAAYRTYEERLSASGQCDEHALRTLLMSTAPSAPLRHVIVSVADVLAEPGGLWPADFDLLSRLAGVERIDLAATEAVLAAGYLERLHQAFPDLEEARLPAVERRPPVLVTPPRSAATADELCFSYRDREEELTAVARRLKQDHRGGAAAALHRTTLVVRRPLPYLYIARDVFRDAGIPFETLDTLPLAAEPYAAAVDLVLDAVASEFTRASLMALVRSPHFSLDRLVPPEASGVEPVDRAEAVAACDTALAEARYLGGFDRLDALVEAWSRIAAPASREERRRVKALPLLRACRDALAELCPLATQRRLVDQIATLTAWLRRYDRPPSDDDPTRARRQRVRSAVLATLASLAQAYEAHDPDAEGDVVFLTAALRRWLGAATFAVQSGAPGLQIVDAYAARYGDFDDVQLVGLVDGEWPERPRRNVLYPSSLMATLEPAPATPDPLGRSREALRAARAAFRDLVLSAADRVRLSTFLLENDAVVERSILLDEVAALGLTTMAAAPLAGRVLASEAVAHEPRRADVLGGVTAEWAALRVDRAADSADRRGDAGPWRLPRVSISRLELFLNCPFKFFAANVLRLEETPEDQDVQSALERGLFLHELWERFFSAWQQRGRLRIDADLLPEARALFVEICEEALQRLSPAEAALERVRLIGSAVSPGIAYRVFAMEASRPARIVERLLEFPIEGEFAFRSKDGTTRQVAINAKADRIDVLEGGALRVIDYKSKTTPDPKLALQLPIYAHLAREILTRQRGGRWTVDEALYVSFEGERPVVALRPSRGQTIDDLIAEAEARVIDALDRIAAGKFPAQPAKKSLCGPCGFRAVCRLEYVENAEDGDEDAPDAGEPQAERSAAAADGEPACVREAASKDGGEARG